MWSWSHAREPQAREPLAGQSVEDLLEVKVRSECWALEAAEAELETRALQQQQLQQLDPTLLSLEGKVESRLCQGLLSPTGQSSCVGASSGHTVHR